MKDRRALPLPVVLLTAIAVAVIVAAVIEVGPSSSSARTETQLITAAKGVVQSTVTGTGNVEPGVDDDVNFKVSGTLQNVYVSVGQHVIEGQLLATLNRTSARLSLDQAREQLKAARDQLTTAKADASYTRSLAQVQASSTEFVSYTTSTTPTGFVPPTGSTGATGSTGPKHKHHHKKKKKSTGAGSTGSGTGAGTGSGASTGAGTSGASGTSSATNSAASIAQAQASVDSAKASVRSAEQQLDDTYLYAPASGTIVSMATVSPGDSISAGASGNAASGSGSSGSGSSGSGSSAGGLGNLGNSTASSSSSSSSTPFAEIVDSKALTMTVPFSESDITKIKVGQPATVTLDALAGVELSAHVSSIATVGSSSSGVVSYDSTITVDQNDSRVRPGMSASVAVITGQAQGVTLPNNAVSGAGSIGTVQLMKNGKAVSQQVVVGLRGDSRTQIISGLSAGQEVSVTTTLPALGQSQSLSTGSGSGTLGGGGFPGAGGGLGGGGGGGGGRFLRLLGG